MRNHFLLVWRLHRSWQGHNFGSQDIRSAECIPTSWTEWQRPCCGLHKGIQSFWKVLVVFPSESFAIRRREKCAFFLATGSGNLVAGHCRVPADVVFFLRWLHSLQYTGAFKEHRAFSFWSLQTIRMWLCHGRQKMHALQWYLRSLRRCVWPEFVCCREMPGVQHQVEDTGVSAWIAKSDVAKHHLPARGSTLERQNAICRVAALWPHGQKMHKGFERHCHTKTYKTQPIRVACVVPVCPSPARSKA